MNSNKSYKICKRCVMDTSDPEIIFDKNGNCNHCTNYFENISQKTYQEGKSEADLYELIKKIKKVEKVNTIV